MAFIPLAHTLLTFKTGTEISTPPFKEACRAGFCPKPLDITLPNITFDIYDGATVGKLFSSAEIVIADN